MRAPPALVVGESWIVASAATGLLFLNTKRGRQSCAQWEQSGLGDDLAEFAWAAGLWEIAT